MLSQEVYSFGELLTTEIRGIASQGGYPWLYELMHLVNKGEVGRWDQAKELYKSLMMSDESFQGKMDIVDEKVSLLALLELVGGWGGYSIGLPSTYHRTNPQVYGSGGMLSDCYGGCRISEGA